MNTKYQGFVMGLLVAAFCMGLGWVIGEIVNLVDPPPTHQHSIQVEKCILK